MNEQDQPNAENDARDQELVAYLDGELDSEQTHRVEQRLAEDDGYRRRLGQLEEAWEMLDQLPATEVDPLFTRTTVEMAAVAAQDDVTRLQTRANRRRVLSWVTLATGIVATALIGYFGTAGSLQRPNNRLLRDLPVIENIDLYRHVNLDLLEELDRENLFPEDEELDDAI